MALLSEQGNIKAGVKILKIRKTDEIWVNMKHVRDGLGVKNISDLALKEIHGVYGKKQLTKEEIKNYKMTEREICKTFANLSEDELNKMSNKNVYVKNNIMTNIIKHYRG